MCEIHFLNCEICFTNCETHFSNCEIHFSICGIHFSSCEICFTNCEIHFSNCQNKFSNCDGYTCGNPEGKSRNEKWEKTYTCIDGYNSKNKKLIDCKYTLSENDQPIEITPTPDKKPTNKDSGIYIAC